MKRPTKEAIRKAIAAAEAPRPLTAECYRDAEALYDGDPLALLRDGRVRLLTCCDCGLVHQIGVTQVLQDYVIVACERDEEETAKARAGRHPERSTSSGQQGLGF